MDTIFVIIFLGLPILFVLMIIRAVAPVKTTTYAGNSHLFIASSVASPAKISEAPLSEKECQAIEALKKANIALPWKGHIQSAIRSGNVEDIRFLFEQLKSYAYYSPRVTKSFVGAEAFDAIKKL